MFPEKLINLFLPSEIRNNKAHAQYHEFYTIASPVLAGVIFIALVPIPLAIFDIGKHRWLYLLNSFFNLLTLLSMRLLGHYRFFNFLSGFIAYLIIYTWLEDSALIYSPNMCVVHMFLLGAVLSDKKWGWIGIFTNLIFILIIFYQTENSNFSVAISSRLGSPVYALSMHIVITIFLGGFLASTIRTQEENRKQISRLQDQKIGMLDEAVQKRTKQLNNMRQTIASDFHDQTGNMLAAITRQAGMLEIRLSHQPNLLPLVRNILLNSNDLYASSRDFLWNLNHESDNPLILFQYLANYGQRFYNQFDVSFSATVSNVSETRHQLDPFAALNLIYIFKEAMNNVVKHSGADEVVMEMVLHVDRVDYKLSDNGKWLEPLKDAIHYGIDNMRTRAAKSDFHYEMFYDDLGTTISIGILLSEDFVSNADVESRFINS